MAIRIYQAQDIVVGDQITLDELAFHHLVRVLRLGNSDAFMLFNGDGYEYEAKLLHVTKKTAQAQILRSTINPSESPLGIHLFQAVAKGEKMDFILQKACELGVHAVTPIYTQRSIGRLDSQRLDKKMQHWQAVLISACEQSGRSVVPNLHPLCSFDALLSLDAFLNQDMLKLTLDPYGKTALNQLHVSAEQKIALVVGPEGGLDTAEVEKLAHIGFIGLQLGPRILRTETASLSMVAALQAMYGDWC